MNPARNALSRAVNRAIAEGAPVYVNQPAIVTLACGCFFRGHDFITDPECDEHSDPESLDDIDDEPGEFKFDQLTDRAKEHARDQYRNRDYPHGDWWDSVYDDADTVAEMLGIIIDTHPVTLYGGRTRLDLNIWFSGFCSQGDGACFEGRWQPTVDPLASLNKVMEHAPQDNALHSLAFDLALLSERCNSLIPDTSVRVTHSGRYHHSGCTEFDIDLPTPSHIDEDNELQMMVWNALVAKADLTFEDIEDSIVTNLRGFMDWIYDQLEAEHDFLMSDECIDQYLEEMTFDEDGNEIL